MFDPRMRDLSRSLISYSCELRAGEKILIEAVDVPDEMVALLVREAAAAGATPLVSIKRNRILRELYLSASEESMRLAGEVERFRMERVEAYISVRGSYNVNQLSDVPASQMILYQTHWMKPVHMDVRVPNTKWVLLRWPTPCMAQQAKMPTNALEDFYFTVCCADYEKMSRAMQPLIDAMDRADDVRIVSPGTDLTFSIHGMRAVACDGRRNIPDGEVFTAPVRDSVNGTIRYNTPSLYQGTAFSDVALTFKNGKIIEARGNPQRRLEEVLSADEGASYVGEFALGLNPRVTRPIYDPLFDEKIAGSLHVTPGYSYGAAFNGNRSQVHWDLVLIQTPEWGGGEVYFDGQLIRKDGRFVARDLLGLNPDRLI